jgi:hypothetical protein
MYWFPVGEVNYKLGDLKATEMHSLTGLEARSLKLVVHGASFAPGVLDEPFLRLSALGGCQHSLTSGHITLPLLCHLLLFCVLCIAVKTLSVLSYNHTCRAHQIMQESLHKSLRFAI